MRGLIRFLGSAGWAGVAAYCQAATNALPLNLEAAIVLTYAAHLHDEPPRTTERGARLNLKFHQNVLGFNVQGEGRFRWNDAYRSPVYSAEARDAYQYSADWRELYLSGPLGQWGFSAGLQQTVWGRADNLRVADLVNPVNLRDFIVLELGDYRIPVPTIRLTREAVGWNWEFLYLPLFYPTSFAKRGSEFEIPVLSPELAGLVEVLPDRRPGKKLRNGEVGMQAARSFRGLDVSVFAFYTRDDNPVYRPLETAGADGEPGLALQPEYHRQTMLGASLARTLGAGFVTRAELTFIPDQTYSGSPGGAGKLPQSATATALLGLDYNWRNWLFTAQATDRYIDAWETGYSVPRHSPLATLSATGNNFSGKLESRVSFAAFADGQNGYWGQAKTTWKPNDHWSYSIGLDIFGGPKDGLFGRFGRKDRIWIEVGYRM